MRIRAIVSLWFLFLCLFFISFPFVFTSALGRCNCVINQKFPLFPLFLSWDPGQAHTIHCPYSPLPILRSGASTHHPLPLLPSPLLLGSGASTHHPLPLLPSPLLLGSGASTHHPLPLLPSPRLRVSVSPCPRVPPLPLSTKSRVDLLKAHPTDSLIFAYFSAHEWVM